MKKTFLNKMNVLLGLASLLLAGCHSTKNVAKDEATPRPMLKYGVPSEVIAMYGVPYDPSFDEYFAPADTAQTDSLPAQQQMPVMVKYGIPAPIEFVQ